MSDFEAVIGLEVHVQIKTASKMFTRVATGYGEPPNTLTDPTILALPGALPVLNQAALDAIIKTGLMLDCEVASVTRWDRKNYFYPDSPKNYQLSQYDQPVCRHGAVEIELPGASLAVMGEHKQIALTRIHLEEDVGKLSHEANDSLIDYNRAGTPLMEIVTEPVIRSADEAFAFLTSLRQSLLYAGISDCDMEKGQMRCDANISIRRVGETKLGTKVELKNLNSISYVRDGIVTEIKRQINVVTSGGTIVQETRLYDGETGRSASMRSKEMAHDYRYFPDPDLMPVRIDAAWKARLAAELPERPFAKQARFLEQFGLPYSAASVLVRDRALADFFEATVQLGAKPTAAANWITNDLLRDLAAAHLALADCKITAAHLAGLVALVEQGAVSSSQAKEIFAAMFQTGDQAAAIADRKGLRQSSDTGQLEGWCATAIANDPKSAEQVRAGNAKAINALKGAVMKLSAGKANPKLVDEILRKQLGA
ncbi:Asp-tRNA(Asn)/Glu-tRNA(Gln) amidotransferase subunit GatB [Oleiharenicola sp. Vm1]|uniref:Asp-tRNA(Asn)/Glu-tRNA(Gln) amidotransferase subunit GatB n=1 Tax=Oleiharenicola sp. Vm1 TaxID=3398393 RepID=UPI0039F5B0A0